MGEKTLQQLHSAFKHDCPWAQVGRGNGRLICMALDTKKQSVRQVHPFCSLEACAPLYIFHHCVVSVVEREAPADEAVTGAPEDPGIAPDKDAEPGEGAPR